MSETYLVTAKTVEEAIAVANREYADASHDVTYEILEMPKKGFLGIGAKDAKIKITVTKVSSVSSELGSIVDDIRSLKKITARGEEDKPKQKQKQNTQSQPKSAPKTEQKQNNQPQTKSEPKAEQKQNTQPQAKSEPKTEQKQNTQPQAKAEPKAEQKQNNQPQVKAEPKAEQKQNNQPQVKAEPKTEQKQNNQPQVKAEPKAEQKQNTQPQVKAEPKAEQKQNTQPQVKAEPKAETKTEQKPEVKTAPIAETKAEPKPETTTEAKAETKTEEAAPVKFGDANAEYKTSLRNSAGSSRRQPQPKKVESTITEESSVSVSSPMGLTDFVSDENKTGFGGYDRNETKPSGRIGNDIRRKNSVPKKAEAPKTDAVVTATAAPAAAATTKYDIAESDEDYAKLQRLDRSYKKGAAKAEKIIAEAKEAAEAKKAEAAESAAESATEAAVEAAAEAAAESAADAEEAVIAAESAAEVAVAAAADAEGEEEEVPAVPEERKREGITQAEMDYALTFANTLLENMQLHARAQAAECPEGEEYEINGDANIYPKIEIVGDDTGILIGHHGETLDSIQYLTNLSALRKTKSKDGDYVKIVVDIEGYREKREQTLRALAHRMAAKAVAQKRNIFLEPMNAYERRIIHSELQSYPNVSTHSVGSDRDRKIIVTYEGPDKVQYDPNRARRRKSEGETTETSGNRGENRGENRVENAKRRPRKTPKMPIEKIDEVLPD